MKRLLVAMVVPAMLAAAVLVAADAPKLDNVKCILNPKAAAKADKSVDYKGGKVYFCCDNCPKKFDATKNAAAANHQLVATGQAKQAKCPLSGGDLNPATKITIGGADVCFCCDKCKAKAEGAKGAEQVDLVFGNAAFEKAGYKVGK